MIKEPRKGLPDSAQLQQTLPQPQLLPQSQPQLLQPQLLQPQLLPQPIPVLPQPPKRMMIRMMSQRVLLLLQPLQNIVASFPRT